MRLTISERDSLETAIRNRRNATLERINKEQLETPEYLKLKEQYKRAQDRLIKLSKRMEDELKPYVIKRDAFLKALDVLEEQFFLNLQFSKNNEVMQSLDKLIKFMEEYK